MPAAKPSLIGFDADGIPPELKTAPRWAPWAAEWNAKRQKYDKVPRNARSPEYGLSTARPERWFTFDAAMSAMKRAPGQLAGVGYCMTRPHGVVGIDLDRCVSHDGTPLPWAAEVIQKVGSYTERSPSGNGLRILALGGVPCDWTNHEQGIEVYGGHEARFLTVTGMHLEGAPGTLKAVDPLVFAELATLYAKERQTAQIIDISIPDVLDDFLLPDVEKLPLPGASARFLACGEHNGDGSGALFGTGVALYSLGFGDEEVFSILATNEYSLGVALDHRRQDHDRALLYLWREHCVKAKPQASLPATADEFDDVTLSAAERSEQTERERGSLEAKRREHQKRENERIGEGDYRIPIAEKITLESALERFVFLSEGSQVVDVFNPHYALKLPDWKNTYAASLKELPGPPGKPPRVVPVTQLWQASELRKTATTRTFKADGGLLLPDPDGKLAVNSWRPFDRSLRVADPQAAGVGLFLDHISFLFGEDAPRFLDWLAHIEQRPGVLPHTSWLHIARQFGMGRNWLASVLSRVWAGSVASNLDLIQMLKGGFNEQLSRKVLAVVDEIREGGRDSQWEYSEKLKSLINEEVRRINPKYGHVSKEFNSCRWLMFSNHLSAIPIENKDRRFEVVALESAPKGPEYYIRLYQALESREFIAAVATVLRERDISNFNPGAHARNSKAKQAVTDASRTPMAEACQLLVEHWPADFITAAHLLEVLSEGQSNGSLTAAHRRTLEQAGIRPFGRAVKIEGKPVRVSVLRNSAHWLEHGTADDVRKALERVDFDTFELTAFEYLLGLAAET